MSGGADPGDWSRPLFSSLGVECADQADIGPAVFGEEFAFLTEATERWLANFPGGPLALDGHEGAEKIAALAAAQASGFLGGRAELPPARALAAGIAEEISGDDGTIGYGLTDWGRRGIGLIFAAIRVQERHLPEGRQMTPDEFAGLLQATLPLLELPEGAEGIIEFRVDPWPP